MTHGGTSYRVERRWDFAMCLSRAMCLRVIRFSPIPRMWGRRIPRLDRRRNDLFLFEPKFGQGWSSKEWAGAWIPGRREDLILAPAGDDSGL